MKTKLPKLTQTGAERLLTLIEFLEQLEPEKFYFGLEVKEWNKPKTCGTVCCAMGWTPKLFPKIAMWTKDPARPIILRKDRNLAWSGGYANVAEELFSIPHAIASSLFYPNDQDEVHHKLPNCGFDATPQEVASMLRKYIELAKIQ